MHCEPLATRNKISFMATAAEGNKLTIKISILVKGESTIM